MYSVEPNSRSTKALTLALLSILLIAAKPALGQTETVLYSFAGVPDGADPNSRLAYDGAGNFYGTTFYGGVACPESPYGCGTVFELSPNGNNGWNEKVLHDFTGGTDGGYPYYAPVILDKKGNLYGTTTLGGATAGPGKNGSGVVYELSRQGESWKETVLYNFCSEPNCSDGVLPGGGLVMDSAGNLYGSVWYGIFELSPSAGGWTEQIIYTTTAVDPSAGLIMNASGDIFGVGSSTTMGVPVFELTPNGSGGWNGTVIHKFPVVADYYTVAGTPALDKSGNLYGTIDNLNHSGGYVYKLSPEKNGKWTEKVLLSLNGSKSERASPTGVVLDTAGNVYGATQTYVYELLAPTGVGKYQEKILDAAAEANDMILDAAGNLYGTASNGTHGYGDVFEITP
jgi:uncharacterized repeat protein (TIGR03803 family)